MNTFLVVLVALLGVLSRTLIPYLQTLKENPETTWDKKFYVPMLVSLVISALGFPLILGQLPPEIWESASVAMYATVYAAAWGLTDITRTSQKQVSS